jgi:predicted CXXCH cytochrome family protein
MTRALRPICGLLLALALLLNVAHAVEEPDTLDPKAPCANATCHADFAKKEYVHGPIAVGECKACHTWKDNQHDFSLPREGAKLCTACHDDLVFGEGKEGEEKDDQVVHEPVAEDCVTCHNPHAAEHKGLLVMPQLELCEICHDETTARARDEEMRSRHSVVLKGKACIACHAPHVSSHEGLLAAEPRATCLSCHDKPIETKSGTLESLKAALARDDVHSPVEDEDCSICHTAHGSKQVALLAHPYPPDFYAPYKEGAYALCFECHFEDLITAKTTEDATEFRNGTRNLHALHIDKPRKGRTCRVCHTAHASDQPAQIRTSIPFGSIGWEIPIGFAKTDTGGSCKSGCHEPRRYDREKQIDTAVPAPKPEPKQDRPPAAPKETPGPAPKDAPAK